MKFKQWSNCWQCTQTQPLIVHTIQQVCSLELHFKMIVACIKTQQKDNPSLIKNIQSPMITLWLNILPRPNTDIKTPQHIFSQHYQSSSKPSQLYSLISQPKTTPYGPPPKAE
jgi:hypothetical protein